MKFSVGRRKLVTITIEKSTVNNELNKQKYFRRAVSRWWDAPLTLWDLAAAILIIPNGTLPNNFL